MEVQPACKCRQLMPLYSPTDIPLSLYVHFPWCVKKCPYCDFNSHQKTTRIDQNRYINTLKKDLQHDLINHANAINGRTLQTLFLGGGTPSLFSADAIGELISTVCDQLTPAPDMEITLEANPGTLEHMAFSSYLDVGINRLSLGVQSFNDNHLSTLGRIHDSDSARTAIRQAQSSGFSNINLDIMFGLPNQTLESLTEEVQQALSFDTCHLSFYQLTLEPNTLFHRYPPTLPEDDLLAEMQLYVTSTLQQSGLSRYEVSGYARPGYQCQHNLNYWRFGDYLGIGAGAHSKLSSASSVSRNWKEKQPESYMGKVESNKPFSNQHQVKADDIVFEYVLNALRLKQGFNLNDFEKRTGVEQNHLLQWLNGEIKKGLITVQNQQVACSTQGYLFIDEILQKFLP